MPLLALLCSRYQAIMPPFKQTNITMTQFFTGINYFFKGFGIAMHEKIRMYVIIPLSINFVIFSALIWFAFVNLQNYINKFIPDWLLSFEFISSIIGFIIGLGLIIVASFVFALVANLIAAPFNAILSEKVEQLLTHTPPPSTGRLGGVFQSYVHAISSQIHKLWYTLLWSIVLLILFLIPLTTIIAPPLWMIFGAWMLALEYIDYPANNHEILFKQQREILRKNRGASLGFGGITMLFTMIPILNLVVMPISVVAMTALYVDKLSPNNQD